jgi:hypothetical protein
MHSATNTTFIRQSTQPLDTPFQYSIITTQIRKKWSHPVSLPYTCPASILHELPLLIVQRTGGSCAQPSRDAVEMIRMRAGSPRDAAFLSLCRLGLASDAWNHQLVVTAKKGRTQEEEQREERGDNVMRNMRDDGEQRGSMRV